MSVNTIVHKVTRRYLLQNRRRTAFSFVSITLMVILLTGVFIGKDTVIASFTAIAEAEKGKWHINVYDINENQFEEIIQQPYVEEYGVSVHPGVSVFSQSENLSRPYLDLREYSPNSMDWMNLEITEGRKPEKDGEIILSEALRNDGSDIKTGDEIRFSCQQRFIHNNSDNTKIFPFQQIIIEPDQTVEVQADFPYYNDPEIEEILEPSGFEKTYTVVGFMEAPSFEPASAAGYTAAAYHDNTPDSAPFNLSLRVNSETGGMYEFLREVSEDRYEVNNYVMIFTGQSSDYMLNRVVIMAEVFLSVLILIVSAVLMNNVFALSYDERLKYLGILASVGATGRQKRSSVYYEALFLLAFALPAGFAGGLVLIKAAVSLMKPAAAAFMGIHITKDVPVQLVLKGSSILLIIFTSALTVLVSAFLPARRISKIGPVAGIRGNDETRKRRTKKPARKYSSAEKMLAKGFMTKENKRSSAIVKAMCAFITVMITAGFAASALIQMVSYKLSETQTPETQIFEDYEYLFVSSRDSEMFESIVTGLKETGGVEKAVRLYDLSNCGVTNASVYSEEYMKAYRDIIGQYYPEGISEEQFHEEFVEETDFFADLFAVDDDLFQTIAEKTECALNGSGMPGVILLKDGTVSTASYGVFGRSAQADRYHEISDKYALQPGGTLPLFACGKDTDFFVEGKVSSRQLAHLFEYSGYKLAGIIRISDYEKLFAQGSLPDDTRCFIFDADETNIHLMDRLDSLRAMPMDDAMFAGHEDYMPETIRSSLKALIQIVLASFAAVSAAVCFLNIFNSVNAMITYRRKTFAILKAAGMTDTQLKKTMRYEMAGICIRSVIAGVLISFALCYGIQHFLTSQFGSFTVSLPYAGIISAIAAAVLMSGASGWYTYKKEGSGNLIEEIRRDSI